MRQQKGKGSQGKGKQLITKELLSVFHQHPKKPFNPKQLASMLDIRNPHDRTLINTILDELCDRDAIQEIERGKFRLNSAAQNYITGIAQLVTSGAAYVVSEESEQDVYISQRGAMNAMNGDKVKVSVFKNSGRGKNPEGEIVEIIQRAKSEFVGTIEISKNFAFLSSSGPRSGPDIFIPLSKLKGARNGDKAIAKITDWQAGEKNPTGEIINVLGKAGENNTEMHAILAEYGLPYAFPPEVEADANRIPTEITAAEIAKRKDFRKITTFTIDPVDAKDFDDALSIRLVSKKGEPNVWEIGVHIADVSHYLLPKTILDKEAFERATSVYLVDRVVPMLPEILSNNVCSLRPNEEKLCFSAVFEMDEEANIVSEWFGRTVINSDRRFSYEEAQLRLETQEGDFVSELLTLNKIAKKLREIRFKKGSIGFDKVEVKFNLDKDGDPIGVFFKVAKDSNMLIEDFMLLANRKVAEFVGQNGAKYTAAKKSFTVASSAQLPFVYRIHDAPDKDRLSAFSDLVSRFGYKLKINSPKEVADSMNKLLKEVVGKREESMVEQLAIRTMAKAIYTTKNIGHYGLAFDYYTHFTSPIRRYPDVMVHRLLQHYLDKQSGAANPGLVENLEEKCKHSSDMEKRAAEAERSSIKYKQVQFMQDHIGELFEGVISGVSEWGLYVEIVENHCEGMVRMKDLEGDFFVYDEENYCYWGKRTKIKYQLGDKVMVKIKRADLVKKQLDFEMVKKTEQ
ncbi:MAG: ribonuclease R [Bacteroidetes bacterium]|nr:ribonuclease R [Bacteroidota bacterium]